MFFWADAGDAGGVTGEALLATRSLVADVSPEVAISKKGFVEPLWSHAGDVQLTRSEFMVITWQLHARATKMDELELKLGCWRMRLERCRDAATV